MTTHEAEEGRRQRSLRSRLPTIIAEVVSVVFAVLVALAVDEWWEERENEELGRRAVEAVVAEIRNNMGQLENGRERVEGVMAALDSARAIVAAGDEPESLNIDYPIALLSSAAWQTAQVTRAVHYVPLDVVTSIAGAYDFQAFFLRNQDTLADQIAGMLGADDPDAAGIIRRVGSRYRMVAGFRAGLTTAYSCLLVELDEATADEAAACPEGEEG